MSLLEELHRRFQPEVPLGHEHPEWYQPRTDTNVRETLRRALKVSMDGSPRVLLLGGVGSGKSTELQQMLVDREGREHVVYFDVHNHLAERVRDLQALDALESWELIGLITLALVKSVVEPDSERFKNDPGLQEHSSRFSQAWQALLPSEKDGTGAAVDLGQLLGGLSVLTLADAVAPGTSPALLALGSVAGRWLIKLGNLARGAKHNEQDPRVRSFVEAANALLEVLAERRGRPLLAIVDGLDRVQDSNAAERLVTRSTLLAQLKCGLVIAGPVLLRHSLEVVHASAFSKALLGTVPVLDRAAPHDPKCPGDGVALLRELFWQRCVDRPDAKTVITDCLLDRLAWHSGGHLRTYLHLIRNALAIAIADSLTIISDEAVETAILELQDEYNWGVDREAEVATLLAVRDAVDRTTLPVGDEVSRLRKALRVLTYPGAARVDWHYVHPLLLPRLEASRPREV